MEKVKKPVGRPTKPKDEVLIAKSIRLTEKQWETLEVIGIVRLRKLLDSGTLYVNG